MPNCFYCGRSIQTCACVQVTPSSGIPPGHGRVVGGGVTGNGNWMQCACGPMAIMQQQSRKTYECRGCGAEWDYQTVQNAAIGTDLMSKQTALAHLNNSAGRGGAAQALLNHQAMQQGIVPIVKPYARKIAPPVGPYSLHCSCGGVPVLNTLSSGFWCSTCSLSWPLPDVQAASDGDLLPGTPIPPTSGIITTGSAASSQKLFSLPIVLFDPFDTPGPETTTPGKKCWDCGGDWCEALDSWFGDKMYAQTCAPCRSKRGIRG